MHDHDDVHNHVEQWHKWSSLLEKYNTGNFMLMLCIQRNGTECPISGQITHINTRVAGFLFYGVVLTVIFYVSLTYRQEHTRKCVPAIAITR